MAEKLYFDTSAANNTDCESDLDPSLAKSDQVKSNHLYRSMVTGEVKIGEMPINHPEHIKIEPLVESKENCKNYYTIPEGYHDGTGTVYAGPLKDYTFATATPEDVANNKTFWANGEKCVGTLDIGQIDQIGNATSDDIAEGKTAWVNKKQVTGNLPRLPKMNKTLNSGESYTIPYGISAGTTVISSLSLQSQTPGDALPEDISKGKVSWVNGEKIVGTLEINSDILNQLRDTDALQSHVLNGKKFYSSIYNRSIEGRMTNHTGEAPRILNIGDSFKIPEGYYDGNTEIKTKNLHESTFATAKPENISEGKTAWVDGEKITGTMPNIYPVINELNAGAEYTIPEGYHNGTGKVVAKGMSSQTPGDAKPSDISKDKVSWVNGEKIIGTMNDIPSSNIEINPGDKYYIPEGHHSGTGNVFVRPLSNFTYGTATSSKILNGYSAYVNGKKVIGSIPEIQKSNVILDPGDFYDVPIGYHNESSKIQAASLKSKTIGDALPEDISKGKVSWVNGEKIIGTMEFDGTAISEDVIEGETFYNIDVRTKVTGSLKLSANASENDVLEGISFYSTDPKRKKVGNLKLNGSANTDKVLEGETFYNTDPRNKFTGTMPNIGRVSKIIKAETTYTIPKGYHDGTGTIRAEGLYTQTDGTAKPNDILEGKTSWVNGEKITGTLILSGDAQPEDVKNGVSFYNIDAKQKMVGSMYMAPSIMTEIIAGTTYTIPKGYHDGTGTIRAKNLNAQTDGTAQESDISNGKTAWVNGQKITGSMPDNTGWNAKDIKCDETINIPNGYHNGGFITTSSLASQTESTALDLDILLNKTAWVNGQKITGSMPDNTGWNAKNVEAGSIITIPKGYHDGTGKIELKDFSSQTNATAIAGDILSPKTAWVNGKLITGTIITQKLNKIRISAGNEYKIPAGYYPDGIQLYALHTDRLDFSGTDAYVIDTTLYPNSAGEISNDKLVVIEDHGLIV